MRLRIDLLISDLMTCHGILQLGLKLYKILSVMCFSSNFSTKICVSSGLEINSSVLIVLIIIVLAVSRLLVLGMVNIVSYLIVSSEVYVLTCVQIKLIFGITTLLRSNVLNTIYLMVISSILPRYKVPLSLISMISQILYSLVEKIKSQDIRFPSTSLKANQIPIDNPPNSSPASSQTILRQIYSENIISA